jgi:hypothetical protein
MVYEHRERELYLLQAQTTACKHALSQSCKDNPIQFSARGIVGFCHLGRQDLFVVPCFLFQFSCHPIFLSRDIVPEKENLIERPCHGRVADQVELIPHEVFLGLANINVEHVSRMLSSC